VRGLPGKALTVGGLGVQRGHGIALSSEQRFELGDGGTIVGRSGCRDLPDPMRRLVEDAGGHAGVLEGIPEALLGQRSALLANDERKVAAASRTGRTGSVTSICSPLFSRRILPMPLRMCCLP
jgi:hypothetical protein